MILCVFQYFSNFSKLKIIPENYNCGREAGHGNLNLNTPVLGRHLPSVCSANTSASFQHFIPEKPPKGGYEGDTGPGALAFPSVCFSWLWKMNPEPRTR